MNTEETLKHTLMMHTGHTHKDHMEKIEIFLIPSTNMHKQIVQDLPGPAWGSVGEGMVVSGHSAVVNGGYQTIVSVVKAHATLIILQTIRLGDKPLHAR